MASATASPDSPYILVDSHPVIHASDAARDGCRDFPQTLADVQFPILLHEQGDVCGRQEDFSGMGGTFRCDSA